MSNENKKSGGNKKHGRNRKMKDQAMSAFARGKISFSAYEKRTK